MTQKTTHLFLIFIFIFLGNCSRSTPPSQNSGIIQAQPWQEADALFRSNPKWLGSDDAYSIDLGNGRVLWLFGDTFIATSEKNIRRESIMIRNSVAIQFGYDPSAASMKFYWNTKCNKPRSFFPDKNYIWYWPGHGIKIKNKLIIFLMATRASQAGLEFESAGWQAVMISDSEKEPAEWQLDWLESPSNNFNVVIGSASVIQIEDFIYAFSSQESGNHNIFLIRWQISQAAEGNLSQLQWWTGENSGWVKQQELNNKPVPVFSDGQTEFTVHYEPLLGQYLEIQTVGFGAADLAYRLSNHPTGTWSKQKRFYRPHEYNIKDIIIYAAKAHPHLTGADLILTYATNYFDFGKLVKDNKVYYPRFLKTRIKE